jgi:hypothetical protein
MRRSAAAVLAASVLANAQATGACVSLEGSSVCKEFGAAQVSTDEAMIGMLYVAC